MPTTTLSAATRAAITAISTPAVGDSAILAEAGREGVFSFSAENHWDGVVPPVPATPTTAQALAAPGKFTKVVKTASTDAYDASADGVLAFTGDFEIVAYTSEGQDDWEIGVSASTTATAPAGLDYSVGLAGSFIYSAMNGLANDMTTNRPWLLGINAGEMVYLRRSSGVITNGKISASGVRTEMQTYTTSTTQTLYLHVLLYQAHTSVFVKAIDLPHVGSGAVQADPKQAVFIPAGDWTGRNGAWIRQEEGILSASWFGASPSADAATNTSALEAASSFLCWRNGGTLLLEPNATYVVGGQRRDAAPTQYCYAPDKILYFTGFDGSIEINGQGATLKLADGLKFGSFDPATGNKYFPTGNFNNRAYLASPAEGVVFAEAFSGSFTVCNLEIDGNIDNAEIGGHFGDTGWQVMNAGLQILEPGRVIVRNVAVRRMGTDGCTYRAAIPNKGTSAVSLLVENSRFEFNGRQGFSLTGGRGGTFVNCGFNHTGRSAANPLVAGPIDSNPHAGFDMEPDSGNYARDIAFVNCEFLNNSGAGYIADSGRTQDISFLRCRFSGDNSYALWFGKPGHVLRECVVAGVFMDNTVTDLSATYEEGRATQYIDCIFKDDPAWTFNGTSIYGFYPTTAFSECCFERCNFDYSAGNFPLPESGANTLYRNCTMTQAKIGTAQTSAQYEGTTILTFVAGSLASPVYRGRVVLNGVEQFAGSATVDWPSIAAGGSTTTTVTVPGARAGDSRTYLPRMVGGSGGLVLTARPTANDVVTVTAVNPTSAAVDLASDTLKVVGIG